MTHSRICRSAVCACLAYLQFACAADSLQIDSKVNNWDGLPSELKETVAERFKGATVLKAELKTSVDFIQLLSIDLPGDKQSRTVEVTISDELNRKFKIIFTSHGELLEAEKHKLPPVRFPKTVGDALKKWLPAATWPEPGEASKQRGEKFLYKVSGKLNGKTVKAEIFEDGTFKKHDDISPSQGAASMSLEGLSGEVQKDWKSRHTGATVLEIKERQHNSMNAVNFWMIDLHRTWTTQHIKSCDSLNKNITTVYLGNSLLSESSYKIPMASLPTPVSERAKSIDAVWQDVAECQTRDNAKTFYTLHGKRGKTSVTLRIETDGTLVDTDN